MSRERGISRSKFISSLIRERIRDEKNAHLKEVYDRVFSDERVRKEQLETARWFEAGGSSAGQECDPQGLGLLGRFFSGQGSEPRGRRPGLVVQCDPLNDSRLNTDIVVAITSTMKLGELPGNVVPGKGEANLPKKSVVNVTQIKTVDKLGLREKIGTLARPRMEEVQAGIKLVMDLT